MSDYPKFQKIPRLHKPVVITEKIDGTNGLISIELEHVDPASPLTEVLPGENRVIVAGRESVIYKVRAGSRNRWLTPESDNFGFAAWVKENAGQLVHLGPGLHFGEWFGSGIQRGYGLDERRFALFNVARWFDPKDEPNGLPELETAKPCPPCCTVVPLLRVDSAKNLNNAVLGSLYALSETGSWAVNGFMVPEGVVVYHMAAGQYFKVLLEGDDIPKSLQGLEA